MFEDLFSWLTDLYLFRLNAFCLVDSKWLCFVCWDILIWFCISISCVCFCFEYFESFHNHQDMSHWHMFVLWVLLYFVTLKLFFKMLSVLKFLPMGTLIWVVGLWFEPFLLYLTLSLIWFCCSKLISLWH